MRGALPLALMLLAGCEQSRPLETPPAFDDSGIVVTLAPEACTFFAMETLSGTVENRVGRDVDLYLCLNLVNDQGVIVGHAFTFEENLKRGETRAFVAVTMAGPSLCINGKWPDAPPPYSKVTRGFVCDLRAFQGLATWVSRFRSPEPA